MVSDPSAHHVIPGNKCANLDVSRPIQGQLLYSERKRNWSNGSKKNVHHTMSSDRMRVSERNLLQTFIKEAPGKDQQQILQYTRSQLPLPLIKFTRILELDLSVILSMNMKACV